MHNISARLREQRDAVGLSQQALADRCGISLRSQQNYEKDRSPDADYLASLVAQGLDVLYILTGQHDPAVTVLDAAERLLIDSYRVCTNEAKRNLIQSAALLSAGISAAPKRRVVSSGTPDVKISNMKMKNTAAGGVQVGYAGGAVNVKK